MSPEERQAENRRLLREARGASDRAPPPPSQFGAPVSPLSGVGGFPRSMASQMGDQGRVQVPYDPLAFQGVPRYEDLGPIQREEEGRRAYEMASRDYSMLPDELGLISPIASIVADPIADAIDVGGAAFGDPASRTRTMARHNRWGQGMGQVGEDLVDPGEGGNFLAQMLRDVPEGMRAEDEARASQFLPAKNGLDRAGDVLRGVWQGVPEYARDTRGRAAQSQALADYEARDAELAGARGEINAPWAEQVARNDARRAAGDDWWANAPFALEAIPGVGLIDVAAPIARSAGRAGLRAAGQDIPQMLARPVDPLHELGPMTNAYRNEGSLFRDAAEGGRNLLNNTPIVRDVAPYAGDWIAGTWQGRAATVPLAAAGTFALSDEEDVGERLKDAAGVAGLAYLGGGLAGAVARTAPRALRDIEVSRATRLPERQPIDVDFSVYRPDEFTEVYVHPDGEIVAKYQGAFESGGGTGAEAVRAFRGMERALGEDIAAHQRPEYHWVPGPDGRPDPRLAEFYREAMRTHAPEGYVFSETPDGVMRLTRSETSDPLRNVNFGEQLNRDGSITPATPIESQGEPDFDLNDALGKITRNVNDDGSPYDDWIGLDGIVPDVGPTRREMLPELQRRQRDIDNMAAQDHITPPTLEGIIANPTQAQWDIDQYLGTFSAAPRHGKPRISADMPLLGTALTAGAATGAGIDYLSDGDFDFGEEAAAAALVGVGARGLRGRRLLPAIRDGERIFVGRAGENHADVIERAMSELADEGMSPADIERAEARLRAQHAADGGSFSYGEGDYISRDEALASLGDAAFGRAHAPNPLDSGTKVENPAQTVNRRGTPRENAARNARILELYNEGWGRGPRGGHNHGPNARPKGNSMSDMAALLQREGFDGVTQSVIVGVIKREERRAARAAGRDASTATPARSTAPVETPVDPIEAARLARRREISAVRDPLTGIALGTGVGAGGYALLSDEAGAEEGGQALEDGRAIETLPEGVDLREGEFMEPWRKTRLSDGSEALTRTITTEDGRVFNLIARQNEDASIDVLGYVRPEPTQGGTHTPIGGGGEGNPPTDWSLDPAEPQIRPYVEEGAGFDPLQRVGAAALGGLLTRGLVPRGAPIMRSIAAGSGALMADAATGGDPVEAFGLAAGGVVGSRLLSDLGPIASNAIGRNDMRVARDRALEEAAQGPGFEARRDAFAATLSADAPRTRNIEANQANALDGRFLIPREEVVEQGFATERVGTQASPREQFLRVSPAEQLEWMDHPSFGAPLRGVDSGTIGVTRGPPRPTPAPPTPDPIAGGNPFYDASGKPVFGSRPRKPAAQRPPLAERAATGGTAGAMQGVSVRTLREIADDLDIETQGVKAVELRRSLIRNLADRFDSTRELVSFLARYGVPATALGFLAHDQLDPLAGVSP